jgi:hypothetical protein
LNGLSSTRLVTGGTTDTDTGRNPVIHSRLHTVCSEYHGYLHKKKEYPHVEQGVKMLAVDAMGAVMMSHGDDFGDDSAFGQLQSIFWSILCSCVCTHVVSGQSLSKFGRAHCKIATLQESFSLVFHDTYLARLASSLEDIEDYSSQRRKLDSRRSLVSSSENARSLTAWLDWPMTQQSPRRVKLKRRRMSKRLKKS